MRRIVNYIVRKVTGILGTNHLPVMRTGIDRVKELNEAVLIENYLQANLFSAARYAGSRRVTQFHRSVFTQNGEDGILEEIFRRIGTSNRFFVEFGVHGLKNNSTLLLIKGWAGVWIGARNAVTKRLIREKFVLEVQQNRLNYVQQWISSENIEDTLSAAGTPKSFDYLSIDLDGNDYWVWKAIQKYRPRVVSIEYNAAFPPEISWVMQYNPDHRWDQSSYFGASLKALEKLGTEKGYKLVGCDFAGCNAFFVAEEEQLELFESPFTAENHYEKPRYFLRHFAGHKPGYGPYVIP